MKKFLYPVLALGAIATLASCASDEPINVKEYDGTARFSINLPNELATRFNDGTNAHKLYYSVFQDGKYVLDGVITDAFSNGLTQEVGIQLVANQEYRIVFFADNATSETKGYTYDPQTAQFGVTYSNDMVNSDDFDAFVNTITYTATGEGTDVPLKRPFAQLNIGTNDLTNKAVEHIGLDKFSSTLTIQPTNILSGINFLTNKETAYSGDALSFSIPSFASLPKDAFPVETYNYIEMNYLLVPATGDGQNSLIDATYVIEANGTTGNTLNLASTPVKTNYQTNVYGALLTTQNKFNVEIKPAFETPDFNVPVWDGATYTQPTIDPTAKTITIDTPAQLAWLGQQTAGNDKLYPGYTINLNADMSMGSQVAFPSIKLFNGENKNFFNGNGHTISDLAQPLFASLVGNVSNLTLENVNIQATGNFQGAAVGNLYGDINNITVKGITITPAEGQTQIRFGGIVGLHNGGNATNCKVYNANITAYHNVGGISGTVNETSGPRTYTNCHVYNSKLAVQATSGDGVNMVGAICGNANGVDLTLVNCSQENTTPATLVGYGNWTMNGNTLFDQSKYPGLFIGTSKDFHAYSPQGFFSLLSFIKNSSGNTWSQYTYSLDADVDMTGITWPGCWVAVDSNTGNNGIQFNGNGHTVSNLAITGSLFSGSLGGGHSAPALFKNVTFDNATVTGSYHVGVIVGQAASSVIFENVHITNSNITGNCNVGGIIGGTGEFNNDVVTVTFNGCSVEKCVITANGGNGVDPTGASGFMGRILNLGGVQSKAVFTGNNVVNGNTIRNQNGQVGGKVYGYTTYQDGWKNTGYSDAFTNWPAAATPVHRKN